MTETTGSDWTKKVESAWPYAAGGLVLILWLWTGRPFPKTPDGLFGASATVASVFASFLGVSKAIILSIKSTETYKVLKDLKYTDDLFGYLKAGIIASVVFAGLSILGFFIDPEKSVCTYRIYTVFQAAWVVAASVSLFTYARISSILFKVLKVA